MSPLLNTRTTTPRSIDIPIADNETPAWTEIPASGAVIGASLEKASVLPPRVADKAPAPLRNAPAAPVRISEGVQAAMLLYGPHPVYPALAKAARSQGVVRMEAIIAIDGTIRDLRVLSGPPLLVEAARDAVRQWRYKPTLLSGVAVEVLTEIDINFTLSQ
jgi:protein TonB